jgi:hypothetical protein
MYVCVYIDKYSGQVFKKRSALVFLLYQVPVEILKCRRLFLLWSATFGSILIHSIRLLVYCIKSLLLLLLV